MGLSRSAQAPEQRAPLETDYTSVDKRIGLHFTSAWDKRVIIFWCFLFFSPRSCQSCNASRTRCSTWQPEQVDDKAAYTFPLIAGSQWNVSEMKMMAQACRASQSSLGPSQSVLNGLHQCVIAITRSSQGPRQDELYFMALQQILFSFLFSSNLNAFLSLSRLCSVVWLWDCFCLWTTSQTVHLLLFLKGTFSVYLRVEWLTEKRAYVYISMLCKLYFRLALACFVWLKSKNSPAVYIVHHFKNMLLEVNL